MAGFMVWLVLVLIYGGMLLIARIRSRPNMPAREWYSPFAFVLKQSRLFERMLPLLQRPARLLAILEYGCTSERLLRWTAECLTMAYGAVCVSWALAAASGEDLIGWLGTAISGCLPVLRLRELDSRVEKRKMSLLIELPVLLSRLLVLVNAGENVRSALVRTLDNRPQGEHLLYDELRAALHAMERGESMGYALEHFGRRCAIPEARMFAAVLMANAKRGGQHFVSALRELNHQMWEKRKAVAKTAGEQASSRLAFPLAIIFLLIVVVVAAPAMLGM
jgi:tight adherence protein C